eukprot:4703385-Alexandrium_andersonii.AAC.1
MMATRRPSARSRSTMPCRYVVLPVPATPRTRRDWAPFSTASAPCSGVRSRYASAGTARAA